MTSVRIAIFCARTSLRKQLGVGGEIERLSAAQSPAAVPGLRPEPGRWLLRLSLARRARAGRASPAFVASSSVPPRHGALRGLHLWRIVLEDLLHRAVDALVALLRVVLRDSLPSCPCRARPAAPPWRRRCRSPACRSGCCGPACSSCRPCRRPTPSRTARSRRRSRCCRSRCLFPDRTRCDRRRTHPGSIPIS